MKRKDTMYVKLLPLLLVILKCVVVSKLASTPKLSSETEIWEI